MTLPLQNRTIALAEGRQLEDLAQMLEIEGAKIVRCPLLSIIDFPDDGVVLTWLQYLIQGRFGWVILLTGEGFRRFLGCAERHGLRAEVIAAFARTRMIVRGPKPVQALKEVDLKPTLVAKTPTTDGVIAMLRNERLKDQTVGVQLYSESNFPLSEFLEQAGARGVSVQPYIYAPASDAEHVVALVRDMQAGVIDCIVFTSTPQIDRLFEVAKEQNQLEPLQQGLARCKVAAVGPIVRETLEKQAVRVDLCPEQGFVMKNLVQQIKRHFDPAS